MTWLLASFIILTFRDFDVKRIRISLKKVIFFNFSVVSRVFHSYDSIRKRARLEAG